MFKFILLLIDSNASKKSVVNFNVSCYLNGDF